MLKKIINIIHSRSFIHSLTTSSFSFASAGLGAIFYLLLARVMSIREYGILTLVISISQISASILDMGSHQGIVRFMGKYEAGEKRFAYIKAGLVIKMIGIAIGVIVVVLFHNHISSILFNNNNPVWPVLVLTISFIAFSFALSISQGDQHFKKWGLFQVGSNAIRLSITLSLFFLGILNALSASLALSFSNFLIFWMSIKNIFNKIMSTRLTKQSLVEFWNLNKWVALFITLASVGSRLDTLMTAKLLNIENVGIYGLSTMMSSFMPQLATALGAVSSSRFSRVIDKSSERNYLLKSTVFSIFASIAVALALIPVSLIAIRITGRADYNMSFIPFLVLLSSMVIFAAGNPIRDSILYFHEKPKFFTYATIFQIIVNISIGIIIIPRLGVLGAALSTLSSQIALLVVCIFYYLKILSREK